MAACAEADGFAALGHDELVAPALLCPEFFFLVHEARLRAELSDERANLLLTRLEASRLERRAPGKLYVVTLDLRLRRAADPLGFVIAPTDLMDAREPELDPLPEKADGACWRRGDRRVRDQSELVELRSHSADGSRGRSRMSVVRWPRSTRCCGGRPAREC